MTDVYRLKMGTVTIANIQADANAIVEDFPHRSGIASWQVAEDGLVKTYERTIRSLNGRIVRVGGFSTVWRFANLNNRMLRYLFYDLAASDPSPLVTIQTRNRTINDADVWTVINARMVLPEIDLDGLNPRAGTYFSPVEVRFVNGSYAS